MFQKQIIKPTQFSRLVIPPLSSLNWKGFIWLAAFLFPFLVYFSYVLRYAVNIPVNDDYGLVLQFLNSFSHAASLREQLGFIWQQHNESREIFLRLLVLLQYWLFGQVNFRTLTILKDIAYAVIVLVFVFQFHNTGLKKLSWLLIPFVMLAPVLSGNVLESLDRTWCLLFSLLFLLALVRNKAWAYFLLYPLSIFTFSGGLVLFPIGNIYLLLTRRWKVLPYYFILSTGFTALYFYHYETVLSASPLLDAFLYFPPFVQAFFAFLGSAFFSSEAGLVFGVLIALALLGIIIVAGEDEDFFSLLSGLLLVSAGAVSLGRTTSGVTTGSLSPHYLVYSRMALILLVGFGIKRSRPFVSIHQRLAICAVVIAAGYFCANIAIDQVGEVFERNRDAKISGLVTFAAYRDPNFLANPVPQFARDILIDANRSGVYPYQSLARELRTPVQFTYQVPQANADFQGFIDHINNNLVGGWALLHGVHSKDTRVFLLLRNSAGVARLSVLNQKRPDVSRAYNVVNTYDHSGFEVYIGAHAIPPGTYQLGLLVQNAELVSLHWDDQEITIR